MTQIEVRVTGGADPEEELRSLLRWLKADDDIGRGVHGVLASSEPARPDHLGVLLDLISLSVSGGLSAAQLSLAIDQWRAGRRGARRVTLRRGGLEIEVDGADARTVQEIAELLRRTADEEQGDAGGPA
ncbi:hypothetical protein [Streptomyces melanogenes]|uniref:effector-associated constant component EACC1 n=1 Tax=Streptomyces melanogenes TaxID=67326 RepID=UPI00378F09F2